MPPAEQEGSTSTWNRFEPNSLPVGTVMNVGFADVQIAVDSDYRFLQEVSRMRKSVSAFLSLLACLAAAPAFADYANDRAEIENISARYMIAVDAGDIETVMSTWAEDGVLDWVGGVENGKAAIRKAMSGFGGGAVRGKIPANATTRQRSHHHILNHVIDVNGNTAKTVAYWFALTNNTPQKDVQLLYFGHYEDELVKQNGHWLFKKRKIYNESQPNRAMVYPGLGEVDPRAK
jgi:ketosteroid isomerase-like protein